VTLFAAFFWVEKDVYYKQKRVIFMEMVHDNSLSLEELGCAWWWMGQSALARSVLGEAKLRKALLGAGRSLIQWGYAVKLPGGEIQLSDLLQQALRSVMDPQVALKVILPEVTFTIYLDRGGRFTVCQSQPEGNTLFSTGCVSDLPGWLDRRYFSSAGDQVQYQMLTNGQAGPLRSGTQKELHDVLLRAVSGDDVSANLFSDEDIQSWKNIQDIQAVRCPSPDSLNKDI
jgi:hypothetical protein